MSMAKMKRYNFSNFNIIFQKVNCYHRRKYLINNWSCSLCADHKHAYQSMNNFLGKIWWASWPLTSGYPHLNVVGVNVTRYLLAKK